MSGRVRSLTPGLLRAGGFNISDEEYHRQVLEQLLARGEYELAARARDDLREAQGICHNCLRPYEDTAGDAN